MVHTLDAPPPAPMQCRTDRNVNRDDDAADGAQQQKSKQQCIHA
jgi:hypothetical protein